MFNNQKVLFLAETFIMLSPMLLLMCVYTFMSIFLLLHNIPLEMSIQGIFIGGFYVLIILLPNILFYSALKNKLNMRIETFLYGIGFLSSVVSIAVFLTSLHRLAGMVTSERSLFFSLLLIFLLFNSLFYTYAAILKNTEKRNNKTIFFLMAITIIFFAALIIKDFEILELTKLSQSALIIPSTLLGLYAGYFAVYRTIQISLRNVAWGPFLMVFTVIFATLLFFICAVTVRNYHAPYTPLTVYEVSPVYQVLSAVYYFLFSFTVSCLVGIVCKRLKNNQSGTQPNDEQART